MIVIHNNFDYQVHSYTHHLYFNDTVCHDDVMGRGHTNNQRRVIDTDTHWAVVVGVRLTKVDYSHLYNKTQ